MKKYCCVVFLVILLASIASAQIGPLAVGPLYGSSAMDKAVGPDPRLDDWGLRDVTWTQAEGALYPFVLSGSSVLGNYLYVFGGYPTGTGQAFNLTTEQWEESTPATVLGWNPAGVATDGAIYLIGGYNGSNLWDVEKFDPTGSGPTGTWTQLANYPVPTRGVTAAWDGGNYIYASGGYTDLGATTDAFRYDISNDTWAPIASMPNVKGFAGGAFVLGKFYVVGGFGYAAQTLEYDPGSNTWQIKAYMPQIVILGTFCTSCSDSLIFTAGGGDAAEGYPANDQVQIYNPLTDIWYVETPLPVPVSANIARWIGDGKIISAGGSIGTTWTPQDTTWKGEGFPTGSLSYNLSVNLVPFIQPVQIPASGGSFSFYAFVTNDDATSHSVQLWTRIIDPTGYVIGPVMGPAMVTLPPSTRGWFRQQNIPGEWIPGQYTYIASAGIYPGTVYASDSLQFTKLTTGDGPWVDNWSCTEKEIAPDVGALGNAPIPEQIAITAQPNPFNPSTVLSYQLPVAGHVSLRIYNTAGRLMTTLVDGRREAGQHEITFDGSHLPSGIYCVQLTSGNYSKVQKMVLLK